MSRSITLRGYRTSIGLEDAFWNALKEIATAENDSRSALIARIDGERQNANPSSAVRVFVLEFYRRRTPTSLAGE